ncbi:GNAT family N-acetyltransferase [Microvirga tunisiensis]|uniref:GNAT family N-acetyltransferase n=1 Tax=Pannonibacter tanglangensis TaxID=2750084 RepID=A0A7X5F3K2_9HYPH|nr:GNAT family N-acetyltransferase [Pannonibacter sp. XCT-53]NBN79086.1 GNAT family N-acetyltransferase [Pannonibacter sp. XCT-53]
MFRIPEAGSRFATILHRSPDRDQLERLYETLPGGAVATPFQTPAVLDALARHVVTGQGGQLRLLEIREESLGSPVLMVPLCVSRRGPVRMGGLPDFDLFDQCAPVLAADVELDPETAPHLWTHVIEALSDVDLVDVKKIPPRIAGRLNPLYAIAPATEPCPMYTLDLTAGQGEDGWRRKHVYKEARGKFRKLQAEGIDFVEATTPAERADVMAELRRQRSLRFQEKQWHNTLEEDPAQVRYFDDLLREGGNRQPLRLFALRDDSRFAGAICAMSEGLALSATLISMGGDEWRRFSPGLVLFARLIDWAERQGYTELCFGAGVQFYKTRFGGDPWPMHALTRPLTTAGNAYLALRRLKSIARRLRDETARLTAQDA